MPALEILKYKKLALSEVKGEDKVFSELGECSNKNVKT
jgi:hypothetical protein